MTTRRKLVQTLAMKPTLSVVIPTYNEMTLGILARSLEQLQSFPTIETLIVDRESSDGTVELAKNCGAQVISTHANTRAERLNKGIEAAQSEMILLYHPRSILSKEGLQHLINHAEKIDWGGFTHQFDSGHPILKFTSWYSNRIRAKISGIIYLDHCIFFRRSLLPDKPYVPEVDIFEDTLLSLKLRISTRPILLPYPSLTSAVRFQKNGVIRQSLINQILKVGYHLNFPKSWMNRIYERKLFLNSKY